MGLHSRLSDSDNATINVLLVWLHGITEVLRSFPQILLVTSKDKTQERVLKTSDDSREPQAKHNFYVTFIFSIHSCLFRQLRIQNMDSEKIHIVNLEKYKKGP